MILKHYLNKIQDFFETNLGKQIKYYCIFYAVMWGLHLVFISLISYFHLLLGHNIRIIGDWISDRGWLLISIVKITVFLGALQFIKLKNKNLVLFKSYLRNGVQIPRQEILTIYIFLLIGIVGIGRVDFNTSMVIEFSRIAYSIIGGLLFYSIDFIVVVLLDLFYPIQGRKEKNKRIILLPLLFYLLTNITFIYEQVINFKLYIIFFFLMYVGEWRRRNWSLPLFFLVLFIVPLYSFLGFDPVWNSSYTFFLPKRYVSDFIFLMLILIGVFYLEFSKRRKVEFVYRD